MKSPEAKPVDPLKRRIHTIIFEADTAAGKAFDVGLLILIILSIVVVMLESVVPIDQKYGHIFDVLEWVITALFTLEYILRIYSVGNPWKYIFSFYGIIDLLAVLPSYLSLFVQGSQYLMTIRAIRLLRVFRIFKLGNYLMESHILIQALRASRTKIIVFLGAVMTVVVVVGTTMYLVEGNAGSGFDSIPRSIYWAIVTVTTVGYGDIAPVTPLGQFLSATLMVMGYGVLAVPTGIVSVELAHADRQAKLNTISCPHCSREGHDEDADFCKFCGYKL
ncbi:ion transporter [Pontibacter sp. G13]|uniref:ion transporter n=1 Tax=Pontibacter sp. G13 TaxID=3074898 RepID=UPI0028896D41|nr:ion transporter [Pontibacter sp. G13]WNJ17687.1 ion transporter [Pontibacter sp. G13]